MPQIARPEERSRRTGTAASDASRARGVAGDGSPSWQRALVVGAVLAALVFVTVGMRVAEVGFYEDDYRFVTPWLDSTWEDLGAWVARAFLRWEQGRPLNHALPPLLGFLGGAAPVPQAVHLLGLAVLLLNGFLVDRVLLRLFAPPAALLGASFFVLFPADTTRLLPTHLAEIQAGMALMLLGVLAYLRGGAWRAVGYGVAACSLMAYETTYLPFVFAPLAGAWTSRRELWHKVRRHTIAVGATLALFAAIRLALQEPRLVSAGSQPLWMLWRVVTAPLIGAAVSGGRCVLAPFEAVGQAPAAAWSSAAVGALAVALGGWVLSKRRGAASGNRRTGAPAVEVGQWLVLGLAAVLGSYVLTLVNYPPTFQFGRLTSVHTAAGFGGAVLFAGVIEWTRHRPHPVVASAALPLAITYLFGAGLFAGLIQDQYVRAWGIERRFWSAVVRECPDVKSGTAIFVTGKPPRQEKAIASFEWADTLVPELLFDVPPPPPNLVVWQVMGEKVRLERHGDEVTWSPRFWEGERIPLPLDNVIVLEFVGDGVRRVDRWTVPGTDLLLRSKPRPPYTAPRVSQSTFAQALLW